MVRGCVRVWSLSITSGRGTPRFRFPAGDSPPRLILLSSGPGHPRSTAKWSTGLVSTG